MGRVPVRFVRVCFPYFEVVHIIVLRICIAFNVECVDEITCNLKNISVHARNLLYKIIKLLSYSSNIAFYIIIGKSLYLCYS